MSSVIYYHANCMDGFCSAWIASKYLEDDKKEFIPVNYGSPFTEEHLESLRGKDVYILDFSFKAELMERIIERAKKVVTLDHHRTAKADLEPLVQKYKESTSIHLVFDMLKSGCGLTWKYMSAANRWIKNPVEPWLVPYIEDRDLWLWRLDNSKEINAALGSYDMEFGVWDEIYKRGLKSGVSEFIGEGKAIIRYQNQLIGRMMKHARKMRIGEHEVIGINSPVLQSEIGEQLAKMNEKMFGVVWYQSEDGKFRYSLRSREFDVSAVAKEFGGGEHRQAAGFETNELLVG